MKIREILKADHMVDRIDITVRDRENRFIMRYCIGRDVKPGRLQRFAYESECGDIYDESGMKTLYIKRIIQFRQLESRPQGKEMCVGVIEEEIYAELMDLKVDQMIPYHAGHSDGMHGYMFECHVDSWDGIQGESRQVKL